MGQAIRDKRKKYDQKENDIFILYKNHAVVPLVFGPLGQMESSCLDTLATLSSSLCAKKERFKAWLLSLAFEIAAQTMAAAATYLRKEANKLRARAE